MISSSMKALCLYLLAAAFAPVLHAQTAAAPVADSPGAELATLRDDYRKPPAAAPGASLADSILASSRHYDALAERVEQFLERHPAAPQRWDAILMLYQYGRRFVVSVDADKLAAGARDAVQTDTEARRAWNEKMQQRIAGLIAATDVSDEVWQNAVAARFSRRINVPAAELSAALAEARADLALLEKRYPESPQLAASYRSLLFTLSSRESPLIAAEVDRLLAHPRADIASHARGFKAIERIKAEPMQLKFTAADGREVDLAAYRGKVVLVDFWATWCGPCIAELPHIKKVYAEYRDKGFEIIGITLENPGLRPNDTPEQIEAKLAAARQKMLDFCAKEQMTWPQHYDGRWWKNEIATVFSISAIPAMFLLDQEGKLVTTKARGEALEREVKRLLKL